MICTNKNSGCRMGLIAYNRVEMWQRWVEGCCVEIWVGGD
jgi:hypothetical protein